MLDYYPYRQAFTNPFQSVEYLLLIFERKSKVVFPHCTLIEEYFLLNYLLMLPTGLSFFVLGRCFLYLTWIDVGRKVISFSFPECRSALISIPFWVWSICPGRLWWPLWLWSWSGNRRQPGQRERVAAAATKRTPCLATTGREAWGSSHFRGVHLFSWCTLEPSPVASVS